MSASELRKLAAEEEETAKRFEAAGDESSARVHADTGKILLAIAGAADELGVDERSLFCTADALFGVGSAMTAITR